MTESNIESRPHHYSQSKQSSYVICPACEGTQLERVPYPFKPPYDFYCILCNGLGECPPMIAKQWKQNVHITPTVTWPPIAYTV